MPGLARRDLSKLIATVLGLVAVGSFLVVRQKVRTTSNQVRPRRVATSGGATILVRKGGDLQAAIDKAQYGDTIVLDAGASYESPYNGTSREFGFSLPDKGPGSGGDDAYITIRTSNLAALPAAGVRVAPADAPAMARIVANAAPSAVEARQAAHHYKFVGIEFTNKDATGVHTNALISSQGYIPQGTHPHHIVIDRCYLHPIEETTNPASTSRSVTRGVYIDGAEISILNSCLSGFGGTYRYGNGLIDSEAILVVSGPGPYHFVNDFLEAWYANIFMGGGGRPAIMANTGTVQPGATLSSATLTATPNLNVGDMISFPQPKGEHANGLVLSKADNKITFTALYKFDPACTCQVAATPPAAGTVAAWNGQQINNVEIRGNTFNKRREWLLPGYSEPKGYFEFKNGNNITLDANTFQGYPTVMAFTSRNDYGANPWSTISNLVITNNQIIGYREGILYLGKDTYSLSQQSVGVTIANNLFIPSTIQTTSEHQSKFLQLDGAQNVHVYHNTVIGNHTHIMSGQSLTTGLVLRDNIFYNGEYGFSCFAPPNTVESCWPNLRMAGNVIVDNRSDTSGGPPTYARGNLFSASISQLGFMDYQNGNYQLSRGSRFRGRASDGSDPGVDLNALKQAISQIAKISSSPNK